jgi:catechol 2,3-dioxygenase-like lactoylglutathione lyase family enzyme
MKFKTITPMLQTTELDATVDFYTKILGFTCGEKNNDWGWAIVHRDDVEIMFAKPNAHTPFEKPQFTGSLYIETNEVDKLWEQLKDKVKICYAIDNFDWKMREFAIYDNNGYTIQFGQAVI